MTETTKQIERSLFLSLLRLTFVFIAAQLTFFFVHYKVSQIMDALANTTILQGMAHSIILIPVMEFIVIQLIAYGLLVLWLWFISISFGEFFKLSETATYRCGILIWIVACSGLMALNYVLFPGSFFAEPFHDYLWLATLAPFLLVVALITLVSGTILAYVNFFKNKNYRKSGIVFLVMMMTVAVSLLHNNTISFAVKQVRDQSKPNIIFIGLDSLRPDYTSYFGNQQVKTPNVDQFLQSASVFTQAYTPLARTFPSWMSILTAKYPLHNHARVNLADPTFILRNDTFAKKLKANGYLTIYGTDETRFTDITQEYGFDRIIGPKGGAVEFLLGSLSDFPLTNLLVNLPFGKNLFPYNYGNRAADITYEPKRFLQLVKFGLADRPNHQPVFLAMHLCLSHSPFTWAGDGQSDNMSTPDRYKNSVEAVDAQLGELMQVLKRAGLLEHSIVVLLSDHGVTLGMRGDRLIDAINFRGDQSEMKKVTANKLDSAPDNSLDFKRDYSINTSYGQGTDVMSPKQNHIVLAFKGYDVPILERRVTQLSTLLDIAPTLLDYLHLPPLQDADGISLAPYLYKSNYVETKPRTFFIETGDKIAEIETNKIYIEKVLQRLAGVYRINTSNGLLILDPAAEQVINENKQIAVMQGDWMLARYPAQSVYKFSLSTMMGAKTSPYYILANTKTNEWTVGFNSTFAKEAPVKELLQQLNDFYGGEV